jgi:hypothetical protein
MFLPSGTYFREVRVSNVEKGFVETLSFKGKKMMYETSLLSDGFVPHTHPMRVARTTTSPELSPFLESNIGKLFVVGGAGGRYIRGILDKVSEPGRLSILKIKSFSGKEDYPFTLDADHLLSSHVVPVAFARSPDKVTGKVFVVTRPPGTEKFPTWVPADVKRVWKPGETPTDETAAVDNKDYRVTVTFLDERGIEQTEILPWYYVLIPRIPLAHSNAFVEDYLPHFRPKDFSPKGMSPHPEPRNLFVQLDPEGSYRFWKPHLKHSVLRSPDLVAVSAVTSADQLHLGPGILVEIRPGRMQYSEGKVLEIWKAGETVPGAFFRDGKPQKVPEEIPFLAFVQYREINAIKYGLRAPDNLLIRNSPKNPEK